MRSGPTHTCTPKTSFALFNPQLPSSRGGPSSFRAPSQGRVGVLSRVAGADGSRARGLAHVDKEEKSLVRKLLRRCFLNREGIGAGEEGSGFL